MEECVTTHLPDGCSTTDLFNFSVQEAVGIVMQPLAQAQCNLDQNQIHGKRMVASSSLGNTFA